MSATPYTIRNYRPDDFDSYVRLCRESGTLGPSGHPVTAETAAAWLEWPHYNPEKDLFLAEDNGEIIGVLDLRPEPDIDRAILRGWIAPEHRRQGLDKELLSHATQRARETGVAYLHVNIPADDGTTATILSGAGFRPIRYYLEMRLDLTRLDKKKVQKAHKECRCLKPGEEIKLTKLQNRAFEGQWGYQPNTPDTITYYTRLGGFSPEQVLFVCDEDRIIGYCWVEIIPDDEGWPEGVIHMLGTDPDYQGRGVGKKALLAGLAYLKKKGILTATLNVDRDNWTACGLYESIGFKTFRQNVWYEKRVD